MSRITEQTMNIPKVVSRNPMPRNTVLSKRQMKQARNW